MKLLSVENTIQQNLQKVWECWTSPEHIVHWNFAIPEWHCPAAEHELKVGGKLKYNMAAKDESMSFDYEGTFTQIAPNELLEYTLTDGRKVAINYTPEEEATKVVVAFEVEDENSMEIQKEGWQAILDNFKVYAESL